MSRKSSTRAYELDTLRGLAMVFVIFMHTSWDLKYAFALAECNYLEAPWFTGILHPFFLVVFVAVSGVCCTFSRSNLKRGLKLLAVALALTLGTAAARYYLEADVLIIFNVLHLLSCGILLYALIGLIEKKTGVSPKLVNALIGFFGALAALYGSTINVFDRTVDSVFLIPVGITMESSPSMADYMPLFPWIGIFMVGVLVGRTCYSDRKSVIPPRHEVTRKITAPFEFIGRHSLLIYLVHQPVVLGICYLISQVTG